MSEKKTSQHLDARKRQEAVAEGTRTNVTPLELDCRYSGVKDFLDPGGRRRYASILTRWRFRSRQLVPRPCDEHGCPTRSSLDWLAQLQEQDSFNIADYHTMGGGGI